MVMIRKLSKMCPVISRPNKGIQAAGENNGTFVGNYDITIQK